MRVSHCFDKDIGMKEKTGILFDLDGTLLNTLDDLADAINYMLHTLGYPQRTLEQVRCAVGNGVENLVRGILPAGSTDAQVKEALSVYRPYYESHSQVKTRPYEGIMEVLAEIQREFPVAIVSNKQDVAVKALCKDYFPGIYALGEISGCPRKPAPDMLNNAMAAIGVERCIYVGDSEVDIITAKNTNVPCVSVLWGFRKEAELLPYGPDCFCRNPSELPDLLRNLCMN